MGLMEGAFQKIWRRYQNPAPAVDSPAVESLRRRLELLAQLVVGDSVYTHFSHEDCGLAGFSLALPRPKRPDLLASVPTYQYLTLLICESKRLGFRRTEVGTIEARREFLTVRGQIEKSLNESWPGFAQLQIQALQWAETHLSKRPQFPQRISDYELYTCPTLPAHLESPHLGAQSVPELSRREKSLPQSEKTQATAQSPQYVQLEKEKFNPIDHSFEKLETADEYKGGRKVDSGSDELSSHSEALQEVNLSQVTRDGEAAQSVVHSAGLAWNLALPEDAAESDPLCFLYPEWDSRRRHYLTQHCRLYETRPKAGRDHSLEFLSRLQISYRARLESWRAQLSAIVCEPLWQRHLLDGNELDVDAFITAYADLVRKIPARSNWYAQKQVRHRDLEVLILIDQSQSSDAWVDGVRVLDVTLESVGLLGLLFDQILPFITVASSWSATRHGCHYHLVKGASEPWSHYFQHAPQLEPQGYTRLGPALRHAIRSLRLSSARKKVLLLFTDGKPTDLDGYEGAHGLNDMRQAFLEARAQDIHPLAFVIGSTRHLQSTGAGLNFYQSLKRPADMPNQLFQTLLHLL